MNEHDLTEIDLRQGDQRVRIRRGGESAAGGAVRAAVSPPPAAAPAPQPSREAPSAAVESAPKEDYIVLIKSPMVGTFYAAPDPDSPPYVKVGDPVGPETVVCIVEAMKVFNQIPAEVSGKIVARAGRERRAGGVRPAVVQGGHKEVGRARGWTRVRRSGDAASTDRRCSSASWWPTAARSPCGSSAPAANWASRRWPSSARPTAEPAYLETGRRGLLHRPAQGRRQLPEDRPRDQRRRDRQRAGDSPGLRLPGRERPFRRGLPELQHRVHRPVARGHGPGGRQERGPRTGPADRACPPSPAATAWSATSTRPWRWPGRSASRCWSRRRRAGGGRGMRVALDDKALAGFAQAGRGRGRGRLRQRRRLPGEVRRASPPRRGPGPRRPARQRGAPLGARLHHAAAAPEADRGKPRPTPGRLGPPRRCATPPCD